MGQRSAATWSIIANSRPRLCHGRPKIVPDRTKPLSCIVLPVRVGSTQYQGPSVRRPTGLGFPAHCQLVARSGWATSAYDRGAFPLRSLTVLSRVNYICRLALPHLNRYPTKVVASNKMLPQTGDGGGSHPVHSQPAGIGDSAYFRPLTLESWPETDRIMARGYTPGNQG